MSLIARNTFLRRACSLKRLLSTTTTASNISNICFKYEINDLQDKTLQHRSFSKLQNPISLSQSRSFSGKLPITIEFITERVLYILKLFDKIDPEKVTLDSHFINDLGLDSLDQIEILVQVEQEFFFDIPDLDGEKLWTGRDIVQYVADHEDIHH